MFFALAHGEATQAGDAFWGGNRVGCGSTAGRHLARVLPGLLHYGRVQHSWAGPRLRFTTAGGNTTPSGNSMIK